MFNFNEIQNTTRHTPDAVCLLNVPVFILGGDPIKLSLSLDRQAPYYFLKMVNSVWIWHISKDYDPQ